MHRHSPYTKRGSSSKTCSENDDINNKVESWAKEGVEKMYFSGKDMDALKEKIAKEEIDKNVEAALSYKMEIPYFLPRTFVKDQETAQAKEHLELENVGDLKDNSTPEDGPNKELEEIDSECIEKLEIGETDWDPHVKETNL